jgi:hypothetical protein
MKASLTAHLTSSKVLYLVAAVVPFGFVALAVLMVVRRLSQTTATDRIAAAAI